MDYMLNGTSFSTINFDALLQAWSEQSVQTSVRLHGGSNPFSVNSLAAREILTNTYGWTIDYSHN